MSKKFLTYTELAAELNLPLGTLYSLKSRGELPFVQLGRRLIRFPADQIEKWLSERSVVPVSPTKKVVANGDKGTSNVKSDGGGR